MREKYEKAREAAAVVQGFESELALRVRDLRFGEYFSRPRINYRAGTVELDPSPTSVALIRMVVPIEFFYEGNQDRLQEILPHAYRT